MGIFDNLLNSRAVKRAENAVQRTDGFSNFWIQTQNHLEQLKFVNKTGKYDNFYADANKLVMGASKYLPYYAIDNEVADPDIEGTFAYYLKRPNDSFPQRKVFSQIYTELITHGKSELFFWRADGKSQTTHFDKQYPEDTFRGFTLVSGVDKTKLSKQDLADIVTITYGVSQANVFMGYSPTQAANSWRQMQDEMGLHMTQFAKNAGMPLGQWLIYAPSIEQYVQIRNKLDKRVSGARNAGKHLYSYIPAKDGEPQIKWQQFTARDVQDYTTQLEFSDKKMTQSFGVPGTIKGTNDGENYATANVSKRNFVEWSLEPLVRDVVEQIDFQLEKRFALSGEIKVDIPLPELADESLVKIQATTQEVAIFDQKIAEGYTAESIVRAYNLPERFLLLEKASNSSTGSNTPHRALDEAKNTPHKHHNELERHYQNALTKAERKQLEDGFSEVLNEYADRILAEGYSDELKEDFKTKMVAHFGAEYANLYESNLETVGKKLADVLDVVDVASLELSDDELEYAREQYLTRVDDFSKTFADYIAGLEGEELEVTSKKNSHVEMVKVTESEHTRIVSELKGWEKAQEEFPVRVYKTWHTKAGACDYCLSLEDTTIDVTALFVKDPNIDEIYEVQGGGAHQNCRCYVDYSVRAE